VFTPNPTYSPAKPIVQKVNTAVQTISLYIISSLFTLGASLLFDILVWPCWLFIIMILTYFKITFILNCY